MRFYIGSKFSNHPAVNTVSCALIKEGFKHTFDWTKGIHQEDSFENMLRYSLAEKKAIEDADIVIFLLPGGRGTHIEIGMAIALEKKIYICSSDSSDFDEEHTVNFYELPNITKLVGNIEQIVQQILALEK